MTAGNLYFPSDGHKIERSNGSTWDGWGPIYPLSDATLPSLSWQNQGTNTTATTFGFEEMTLPNVNNAWAFSMRYIALPAAPYSLRIGMLMQSGVIGSSVVRLGTSSDYMTAGLAISDGTKSRMLGLYNQYVTSDSGAVVWYFATASTAPVSRTASPAQLGLTNVTGALGGFPVFWKFVDDNTNWWWSVSANGRNYSTILKEARNTDLTPTRIGYGASYASAVTSGTTTAFAHLISWQAGTT